MNKLIQAFNETTTEKGGVAYHSTMNANLDFFFAAGSSRGKDISYLFSAAYAENPDLATRILLWCRDVREGAGERQQFKNLVLHLIEYWGNTLTYDQIKEKFYSLCHKIVEVGRFDDLMVFWGTNGQDRAAYYWVNEIYVNNNGLAAKWAPRKDKKGAKPLRRAARLNEHQWRKEVVERSNTVEQKMCAKQWNDINFEHVPSLAMTRYQKAFTRNAEEAFQAYKDSLVKGEAKVSAGAVYPYDIIKPILHGKVQDTVVLDKQWESLPDYVGESGENFLPIIDVSGSMFGACGRIGENLLAGDIAVGLGVYLSERCKGAFKDWFMTFSESPSLVKTTGTLTQRVRQVRNSSWGYNTNLQRVFDELLAKAIANKVPQEDMPTKLFIVSDMQFDTAIQGGKRTDIFEYARRAYEGAGYKLPQLVFWQVNARAGGIPVTQDANGTALVSGFSPSILKSLLKGDLNPIKVMLDTVMVERYNLN